VVTVTGSVKKPSNLLVRIGTSFKAAIDYCGGFSEEIEELLSGGPMMGVAQYDFDVPVIKGTSGILALSHALAKNTEEQPCIRCGKCVEACPVGLQPLFINACANKGDFDWAEQYHAMDCIECGCCSYICPSKRRLVQSIRLAKGEISKKRRKKK